MSLTTHRLPDLPNGLGRRVALHFVDANVAAKIVADLREHLSVGEGYPQELIEVENAYLGASFEVNALYDESGRRIDLSAVWRGSPDPECVRAPETIEPPADYVVCERPVLFLSQYFAHWGHALTEGTSRLWARYRYPELAAVPAVYAGLFDLRPREDGVEGLFDSLRRVERLEFWDRPAENMPIKLKKAFVPAPSFVNRAKAFPGHLAALRALAERILGGRPPGADSRPVYFSRSRLATAERKFDDEDALETALAERGFLIVHPELMTFRQQVELVNAHRVFVGVSGSALHNVLFALRGEEKVAHILVPDHGRINKNQILIDAIVGMESHYVGVCRQTGTHPDRFQINVFQTLDYLRGEGLMGIR